MVNCLTTASFDPLVRLDQDKCYKVCSNNKKGMVSKFQGKETLTEISRMTVLLLYYGILISYTENLSLEPKKGEKICLRSTTADGFFLTLIFRCSQIFTFTIFITLQDEPIPGVNGNICPCND